MPNTYNKVKTILPDETTAIILAGGKGTRLQSVVSDRPKPLALVSGRPFIEYLLDQLNSAGFKNVIISSGHLGEQINHYLGNTYKSLQLHHCHETLPLGTAGALQHALPLVTSQQVLVLNGDSYCDIDFIKLLEIHQTKAALVTISTVAVPDVSRYGSVTTTNDGLLTDFLEKGGQATEGFINAGIYVIERDILLRITPKKMISLEREIFPLYLGKSMYAYKSIGAFIDIGVPDDYKRAQQLFQHMTVE